VISQSWRAARSANFVDGLGNSAIVLPCRRNTGADCREGSRGTRPAPAAQRRWARTPWSLVASYWEMRESLWLCPTHLNAPLRGGGRRDRRGALAS